MDKIESAFELLTRAHSEWEEGCYEKAVSKLNQAKEKIISLSDNGGKLRKIVADIDEQLDAIETEQAARDQLLEALLNSRTPEVPPADPGTWSAPTPRPALQKKRATPDNKKSSSRVPIPKVPTDRDKRPTRAGNSTDEPAPDPATVRRNSIIDKYCTTGSYDRSLLDAVLSMLTEGAPVHWSDITGLEVPKETFRQTVILPRIMPEFFTGIRRPANAILMFGPPGSGKTLLAKAVATESNSTFFLVQTADLASKWRGDAEKIVKLLFNVARDMSPATIFFDEIDAIASQRGSDNEHEASRRLKSQLLVEMDGFSTSEGERILVLGATNFPWHIDEALRRRFEKRIYIDLPEKDARLEMLQRAFDCPLDDTVNLDSVATQLEGYSPADITILCRRASMVGITRYTKGMSMEEIQELTKRELVFPVTSEEIHETLNSVKPSVDPASLVRYQEWLNNYGSS